jgi:hypothetical protein
MLEQAEFQAQLLKADITISMLNVLTVLVILQFHITQSMFNHKPTFKVIYN